MRIREKSLFYDWFHMHREPESADLFFLKFNPSHKLQLLNVHVTQFLLSDVLHCTNINTDFIDFRK